MNELNSWTNGESKSSILHFLSTITKVGSKNYVPPEERVAVFDNDGTLWCEKPLPIQADFLLRKIGLMAQQNPSLKNKQPWKAVSEKNYDWLSDVIKKHYQGDDRDLKLMTDGILQAYQGLTVEGYADEALQFLQHTYHPKFKRPYIECTYLPMVELIWLLEANEFTVYIVSGGGRDFVRVASKDIYGIPPERVIGSSVGLKYDERDDYSEIVHEPKVSIFDDGLMKPVAIWNRIGRRPIFAAGNSNGDIPMLKFCAHPSRPSFCMLVNHDDGKREFAYETGAEKAITLASKFGWTVVNMGKDWKQVFTRPTMHGEIAAE